MTLEEKRAQLEVLQKEVDDLEDLEPEDDSHRIKDPVLAREFYKNCRNVAIKKGLPEPYGNIVKMYQAASIIKSPAFDTSNIKESVKGLETKARSKTPRKAEDYRPNAAQLEEINALSNTDFKETDVYSFPMKACDQVVDRGSDHFAPKALKSIAARKPDKPIQTDHSHSVHASVGKDYRARVYDKAVWSDFYTLDDEDNKTINNKILAGIINKVSVGFGMDVMDYVCDSCGNKSIYSMECSHWPGYPDEKGNITTATIKDVVDYYETSLVAVPAQPAAGIRRNELTEMSHTESNPEEQVKSNDVGRIINDNLSQSGESSVENPNPVVTPAAVEEPKAPEVVVETPKAAEVPPAPEAPKAPEPTPAPAAVVEPAAKANDEVTVALTGALSALAESMTKLATSMEAKAEATDKKLEAVVESVNAQAKIIADAMKSTVDTAVKTEVKSGPAPDLHSPAGSGGILNFIEKSLTSQKSAQ